LSREPRHCTNVSTIPSYNTFPMLRASAFCVRSPITATWWARLSCRSGLAAESFAQQQATEVDVELVLAVDISRSMDLDEQRLQRNGYVEAFRSRDVIDAIASGRRKRIAISNLAIRIG
jgi:Protein of unknown function (DUF1194)